MPNVSLLLQKPYSGVDKSGKKILSSEKTRIYAYLYLPSGNPTKKLYRVGARRTEEEKREDQKRRNEFIIKVTTDFVIYPRDWNFKKQQHDGTGAPEFNRRLLVLKDEIQAKYQEYKEDPAGYTLDQIKQMMKDFARDKQNPFLNRGKSLLEVLDEYVAKLKKDREYSYRTIQKFPTLKAFLQEISESNPKYRVLTFNMINHSFLDDFVSHLRARKPRGRQKTRPEGQQTGLLNKTIAKYIETLKSFLKWSEERGYNKNTVYKEFKMFSSADKKRTKRIKDMDQGKVNHWHEYVYILRHPMDSNMYKIGSTSNFPQRYSNHCSATGGIPDIVSVIELDRPVHKPARHVESYLHGRFKDSHVIGEWYTLNANMISDIKEMFYAMGVAVYGDGEEAGLPPALQRIFVGPLHFNQKYKLLHVRYRKRSYKMIAADA
jgi:hypothetical protein